MPAISATARTEVPAMMPVPSEAGISLTRAEQNSPMTSCGIVPSFVRGTRWRCLRPSLLAFSMAAGTPRALPKP